MRPGEHAGLPVARYLRPEEAVVPFRARPELDELLGWCVSGGHAAVRLVTGDGGAGKTRLALRLGEELAANGWQPLWVPRGSEREAVGAVHDDGPALRAGGGLRRDPQRPGGLARRRGRRSRRPGPAGGPAGAQCRRVVAAAAGQRRGADRRAAGGQMRRSRWARCAPQAACRKSSTMLSPRSRRNWE